MTAEWNVPDPQLVELATDLFERETPPRSADPVTEHFPRALWEKVAALDLPYIGIETDVGGPGGSFVDLLAVVRIAARFGVDLPLAETNLAAWLVTTAGLPLPDGPSTVAPHSMQVAVDVERGIVRGHVEDVAWGRSAETVVADLTTPGEEPALLIVQPGADAVIHGHNVAGLPLDTTDVGLSTTSVVRLARSLRGEMLARGALLKAAQIAGAIDGAYDLTRRYASVRVQFGRPIAEFDGVRQHLVTLAQMSAMTTLILQPAAHAISERSSGFEAYAAKLVANQNAATAVRAAHQVHAAIGMTREYPLHHYTARLRAWPYEFGTDRELAPVLGRLASGRSIAELVTSAGGPGNTSSNTSESEGSWQWT